jgi:hypothetical protein
MPRQEGSAATGLIIPQGSTKGETISASFVAKNSESRTYVVASHGLYSTYRQ